MGRFTVIGLGKFGSEVARALHEKGHEVVALDSVKERVQELRDHSTQAALADCKDPETLRALGVDASDAVVVSLGERMDASILVTLYLKELGVKHIVVKAVSQDHAKVLQLIGATEVVHPERDSALRLASTLGTRSIVEFLPLGVGFSLLELKAPRAFLRHTLAELSVRTRHHALAVAVKNGDRFELAPGGSYRVEEGDILMLVGRDSDLEALTRLAD